MKISNICCALCLTLLCNCREKAPLRVEWELLTKPDPLSGFLLDVTDEMPIENVEISLIGCRDWIDCDDTAIADRDTTDGSGSYALSLDTQEFTWHYLSFINLDSITYKGLAYPYYYLYYFETTENGVSYLTPTGILHVLVDTVSLDISSYTNHWLEISISQISLTQHEIFPPSRKQSFRFQMSEIHDDAILVTTLANQEIGIQWRIMVAEYDGETIESGSPDTILMPRFNVTYYRIPQ